MLEVNARKADIGIKVLGNTVEFVNPTGAAFIRVEVDERRVGVDVPGENGYVNVYNGGGAIVAASAATVTPAADNGGWEIEAFNYSVRVRWCADYTSVIIWRGAQDVAKITSYALPEEGYEED